MASSQKIVALCLCFLLASFGVMVDAGQGMGGGMFGGGGKGGHHGGGHGAIETLLAAGLLAKLLRHGGHGGHGGYGGRSAPGPAYADAARAAYGMEHQMAYGFPY